MQGGKEASYLLIHIVESAGAHYLGGELRDFEPRSDEENIQRYVEDIRQLGYEADYRIGYGRTAKALARVIKDDNCDFLVIGAHGHRGLKAVLLGPTVEEVSALVKITVVSGRKER